MIAKIRLILLMLLMTVGLSAQQYGFGTPSAFLQPFGNDIQVLIIIGSKSEASGFVYSVSGIDSNNAPKYFTGFAVRNVEGAIAANVFLASSYLTNIKIGVWEMLTVATWSVEKPVR